MKADTIIETIDKELLKLYHSLKDKTDYHFFDFHLELKKLNKAILADTTNRQEYFQLQTKQYRAVFYDLLYTKEKCFIEDCMVEELSPEAKIGFLLAKKRNFKKKFESLFSSVSDIRTNLTFEDYIAEIELPPQQTETNTIQGNTEPSQTKQDIQNLFDLIDTNIGWKYAFRNDTDYNTFFDILACYFDNKPYALPQEVIKLNRNCKTRFAQKLNIIYYKKGDVMKKLKKDKEFFNIIRILNHFKDSTDVQIYKLIIG